MTKTWPPRIVGWYYTGEEIPNPTPEEQAWMTVLGSAPDAFRLEGLGLSLPEPPAPTEGLGAISLADYRDAPPPLTIGFLNPEGTTVLFGEGGDGKGWIAAKWASQLNGVAILDFEQHPHEWAYRLGKFGVDLSDVAYFAPVGTMEAWADRGGAEQIRDAGAQRLIVDSAVYASDMSDPYGPAAAMSYKRARAKLGNLPTLLIAHTAKGQESIFGSVFWTNEARLVWRLRKDFVTRQRMIEVRKANNYPDLDGRKFMVEFDEHAGILNLHEHGKSWAPQAARQEPEPEPEPVHDLSW